MIPISETEEPIETISQGSVSKTIPFYKGKQKLLKPMNKNNFYNTLSSFQKPNPNSFSDLPQLNQPHLSKPPRQPGNQQNKTLLNQVVAMKRNSQQSLNRLDQRKNNFFQTPKKEENRDKLTAKNRSKSLKEKNDFQPYITDPKPQHIDSSPKTIHLSTHMRETHMHKTLPSFELYDKEDLYLTQISLKKTNNDLEQQVKQLKTRIQSLYQDLSSKDKLIEKFIQGDVQEKYIQESCIVQSYKMQILELQRKIDDQQEKFLQLQNSLPFTKIYEQQAEIMVYQEECERLRKLLEAKFTDEQIQNFFSKFSPLPSSESTSQTQKESVLQQDNNKLQQQIQDLQQENENLKQSLSQLENQKPIINVKIKKQGHQSFMEKSQDMTESSFKDQKLHDYIIQLEQNYNDLKRELQKIYSPKIRFVLQSISLQKEQQISLDENEMSKCVDLVQEYLPLVDLIMDQDYFKNNLNGFVTLTKEQMAATSIFLLNYIKEKQIPLENEIVRVTGESIDNPMIQNFLKYVSYQSMKSENTFPLQALKIYANPDQSLSEIHDISEQEGHLLAQTIQSIIQNLDKKDLLNKLEYIKEGSLIDEQTFKQLLQITDSNISQFKKLTSLLTIPFNGYLISLNEFKQFLNSILNKPSNSNQQDSNDISKAEVPSYQDKQPESIIDHLKQFLIQEGLNIVFNPVVRQRNVQIGQKIKTISVVDRSIIKEIVKKVMNGEGEGNDIEQFLNKLQISEKKPEVLVYKKLVSQILKT